MTSVLPNVRETVFRQLLWTERLNEFDSIEQYLLNKGSLNTEYQLKMSKKDSALFLYLLGDYGFIRRRVKTTSQAHRVEVRKAFEQHYSLTSFADQFKPSDYPKSGVKPLLLDIPLDLLGSKVELNPVNE